MSGGSVYILHEGRNVGNIPSAAAAVAVGAVGLVNEDEGELLKTRRTIRAPTTDRNTKCADHFERVGLFEVVDTKSVRGWRNAG